MTGLSSAGICGGPREREREREYSTLGGSGGGN